jgi:purine-binding chemotaxis protein CheW
LARLQDIPVMKAGREISAETARRVSMGQRRQSVSFRAQGARLALPMSAIHEIIRVPELLSSVLAGEHCIGMLNLRGHTVPVIDFARFLGLPPVALEEVAPEDFDDERRIIVVKQNDLYFGLRRVAGHSFVQRVASFAVHRLHQHAQRAEHHLDR